MASRALKETSSEAFHFQSVSFTNTKKGIDGLTDATVALWKQGLRVSFWPHQSIQTNDYTQLLLPPYQFEKSRHWLELKSPTEKVLEAAQKLIANGGAGLQASGAHTNSVPKSLDQWTFLGLQENKNKTKLARFRINTTSEKYQRLFTTHVIALTAPIAPATLEIDMAIETLFSLNPEWKSKGYSPIVRDMLSHSPMCADSTRTHYIDLEPLNKTETEWHCLIHSVVDSSTAGKEKHAEMTIHMSAASDPAFLQEFGRYERVVNYAQCKAVLELGPNDNGVEALQGRNVYRAFKEVCDFGPIYEGVRSVVGRNDESAGVVHKRHTGDTWLDVPKADSFGQVAGMYVNLLTDIPSSDMFVATGLELVMRSPKAQTETAGRENGSGVWHVLARHTRTSDKAYVTDIFIFDAETKTLSEVILGLRYVRIAKAAMSKILGRMTADKSFVRGPITSPSPSVPALVAQSQPVENSESPATQPSPKARTKRTSSKKPKVSGKRDLTEEVRNLVSSVSGLETSEMTLDAEMADLGIDSLMGMELAREVEGTYKCTLDHEEQNNATTLRQFIACVANALSKSGNGGNMEHQEDGDTEDDEDDEMFSNESQDEDAVSDISTPNDSSDFSLVSEPDLATTKTSTLVASSTTQVISAREAEAERLVVRI